VVVVDIIGEVALLLDIGHSGLHHLVEDVVGPLHLLHKERERLKPVLPGEGDSEAASFLLLEPGPHQNVILF
jgi:hypothetical protein